ncbi:MAG TPA: hypothetical protein VMB25_08940 [Bryobacteraceae bacterium]|nr:hypothetical protein [Bryobacteraceae bacterium]
MKCTGMLLVLLLPAQAATPVLTRSYDDGRNGANTTETELTPQSIAQKGLKRIKSLAIPDDPRVEAQPLYVPNLTMKKDGKQHNVVFVASMGNTIYAFDADAPSGSDLIWKTSLGKPFVPPETNKPGEHRSTSIDLWGINVAWGILSTPVIDLDANRLYAVNWVLQKTGQPAPFLHQVRLTDGKEIGKPKPVTGAINGPKGTPLIDANGKPLVLGAEQKERAALLLAPLRGQHKTLFLTTTGGENPGDPHGWMVAFDVDTFTETAVWAATQQGFGGGMWQGGQGPSADDAGNVYAMTGNGGFNVHDGVLMDFNGTTDFAEAFVKLHYDSTGPGQGTLTLVDWFIPFRDSQRQTVGGYDYRDQDLGSAAPVLPAGTNLLLGAGKDGILYVLDRQNLGKKIGDFSVLKQNPPVFVTFNGTGLSPSAPNDDFALGGGPDPGQGPPKKTHHLHASPAYWVGPNGPRLFDWGENEALRSWSVDPTAGQVTFLGKSAEIASRGAALDNTTFGGMTGGMISVSSGGTGDGIVWTLTPIDGNANQNVVAGIARAYDATAFDGVNADGTPKMKLLWDSGTAGVTFNFSKFCPPMVADGKLYVATYSGRVDVYALNP